jgi:polysaccharide deacetylase family protein (PEP-CTERM system associated)
VSARTGYVGAPQGVTQANRGGRFRSPEESPRHVPAVRHHFTVDVEEYFQVSALAPYVARSSWERTPSRLAIGMRPLLELLAERNARGTFFTLGWVAKHHPNIVREIAEAGHEVASHGWGHERITTLTPEQFRESVRDSKAALEDLADAPVVGYRAPSFSIVRGSEWALDILAEEGYKYDSSLFPVRRPGYGFAGGERCPYRLETASGPLDEFPPATIRFGPAVLPAGGGAYLRLLPYQLVREGFRAADRGGYPATFYIHPWELDPGQPRLPVSVRTRIRHYGGLDRTIPRLRRILSEFEFQTIAQTLDQGTPEKTVRVMV